MNASLYMLHQQIDDLAGALTISIEQISSNRKWNQQMTNASLDVLHQQINDLAEKEKIVNASIDILHQQIDYLAGTFNSSVVKIEVREMKMMLLSIPGCVVK